MTERENTDAEESVACHPAFAYIGGKRNLAKRLIERIEAIPHNTYCEPFVGAGGVFLRRPTRARYEIVNDLSGDVSTFFRVVQRHYTPFMEMIRYQLASRAEFERLTATDPETMTDLERAAAFLYLQRGRFLGKLNGTTMNTHEGPSWFDVAKVGPLVEAIHERMRGVVIERLDFEKCIRNYDRKATLFYLDPPYHGSEGSYGKGMFSRADFQRLAGVLTGLKGRFILSINDTPEIRETFAGFEIEAVETTWGSKTFAKKGGGKAGELIISG